MKNTMTNSLTIHEFELIQSRIFGRDCFARGPIRTTRITGRASSSRVKRMNGRQCHQGAPSRERWAPTVIEVRRSEGRIPSSRNPSFRARLGVAGEERRGGHLGVDRVALADTTAGMRSGASP
jgi:hypothetical protein